MKTNLNWKSMYTWVRVGFVTAFLLIGGVTSVLAQTTITSDPPDGASGISTTSAVVFTFSAAVDPNSTMVTFYSTSPFGSYSVNSTWNSGNTVLTCTPISPFEPNATINWSVIVNVTPIPIFALGTFSTGAATGGGGGGSGTNAITTFSVGIIYYNDQTNSAVAAPDADIGYGFTATTSLSSNRTATAVTVTLPTGGTPVSLTRNFSHHEDYFFFASSTNQATFESTYPGGAYVFNITGDSNLQGTATLQAKTSQPNTPQVLNFAEAQTVDAAKPFTLKWDPFQGGTAADFISVSVSDENGTNFYQTANFGTNGALPGTATSVVIPAGKVLPNSTNTALVVFYRFQATTNASYATVAYRATGTWLSYITIGAPTTVPVVSNPVWSGNSFNFDVATTSNQVLKVRFSTDCTLPITQWQTILTTNSPGTSLHLNLTPQAGSAGYFRLQSGP
jgi:hypothetical protein